MLTQCADWSQFVVDCFFGNLILTYLTGVLGHQRFFAMDTNYYSRYDAIVRGFLGELESAHLQRRRQVSVHWKL